VGCFRESLSECDSVLRVTFPLGCIVSSLGRSVFHNCSSLQSSCIPSSIETISDFCFSECESLTTLRFERDTKLSILIVAIFPSSHLNVIADFRVSKTGNFQIVGRLSSICIAWSLGTHGNPARRAVLTGSSRSSPVLNLCLFRTMDFHLVHESCRLSSIRTSGIGLLCTFVVKSC
jgi:hypothetical protein